MVFLTFSKILTGLLGPPLLRKGLVARNALQKQDSPYLDMIFFIPYAQKMISLAVYDESQKALTRSHDNDQSNLSMIQYLFSNISKEKDDYVPRSPNSISELRLLVLDEKLRPALLPNETWGDVNIWRWNIRVMKWARMEFFVCKYGPQVKEALDAYPQLRASPQFTRHPTHNVLLNLARGRLILERSPDSTQERKGVLPSSETLIKAFGMRHWTKQKNTKRLKDSIIPIAEDLGGRIYQLSTGAHVEIPDTANLNETSIEDILEVATAGHIKSYGPFNAVCEESDMYQMWTKEYVQHLGDYLLKRSENKPTTIIDIGAGDGLLVHYLREYMLSQQRRCKRNKRDKTDSPFSLIATDDGSWGIFAKADVEKLNVEQTLEKYGGVIDNHQLLIICSWMPQTIDWTAKFRENGADEYILIGEADDGSCGHHWFTWGNKEFSPRLHGEDKDKYTPPYQLDGYNRWDMDVLSQFQFSRFDCALSRSSKTISFRKRKRVSAAKTGI